MRLPSGTDVDVHPRAFGGVERELGDRTESAATSHFFSCGFSCAACVEPTHRRGASRERPPGSPRVSASFGSLLFPPRARRRRGRCRRGVVEAAPQVPARDRSIRLPGSPSLSNRSGVGVLRSRRLSARRVRMPRSPTGSTSGRWSRKIRNISAVHRPMPLTFVSAATTSSSNASSRGERDVPLRHLLARSRQIPRLLTADADAPDLRLGERGDACRRRPAVRQERRPGVRGSSMRLSWRAVERRWRGRARRSDRREARRRGRTARAGG